MRNLVIKKRFMRLSRKIQKLFCRHDRTFTFYPEEVWWELDGQTQGRMNHGASIIGCMDCGKMWAKNYAE